MTDPDTSNDLIASARKLVGGHRYPSPRDRMMIRLADRLEAAEAELATARAAAASAATKLQATAETLLAEHDPGVSR